MWFTDGTVTLLFPLAGSPSAHTSVGVNKERPGGFGRMGKMKIGHE